jgi:acyl transferase domain-containing protein/acyl carrier protein
MMAPPTAESLKAWLVTRLAALRGLDAGAIDVRERFSRYGLDSLGASRLVAELAELLGRPLSPTLMWEAPTIEALAQHVTGGAGPRAAAAEEHELHEQHDAGEPIAIVGMSCRFPGAPDPAAFWRLLRDGVDAIGEVPDDRGWDEILTGPGVDRAERARVRRGGFLDRIDGFDPLFFGISPREAIAMDPQQRLMLELCWEALEDAGIPPSSLRGTRTGVFAGAIWSDYARLLFRDGAVGLGQFTVTGYHHSIIANRISYAFGLMGPSLSLDSACSSALVVAHLACESLRRGESTAALVGAVNLNISGESALGVSRFGALSQDGRCYTFDARANGYVRGEGGGVAVLKTLTRAISDGDPVYCVIRGSAVNNDGASNGLTAPNPAAQEAVLRAAYRGAGVTPSSVQYVEAHGTGTPLGDPIEARVLGAVLGAGRPAEAPLLVGSAKTNVGHLESAAGTVGMLKTALSIKHRLLPPSLNFASPNPHASLAELRLAVPTGLQAWPSPSQLLTAGVSSFGLGGTNGHVVMQEWPAARSDILALSAESPEALRAEVARVRAMLAADAGRTELAVLAARAAAAASRRHAFPYRLAAVATSAPALDEALAAYLAGEASAAIHATQPTQPTSALSERGVVFVFPGQGAQWYGMARSLLQGEPVFRAAIEACDRQIRRHLGISLVAELTRSRGASRLGDIEVSLPAIISIDIAVAAWWRSVGIEPIAVVGHSTGEIAAAHVAGALDLDDTMRVICAYGRTIARQAGQGGMVLVGLPWAETAEAIAGFEGRVFRAIQDSANGTVVAGEPPALAALLETLQARGVFCRRVSMNVAPHSPLVDAMRGDLFALIDGIRPRRGSIPLISEVTGQEVDGATLDAAHWVKNFGDQALFSTAVDTLIGRGHRVFLDVGPHPITSHSVEANLRRAGVQGVVLSSLRRDEDERAALLDTVGALHALGLPVRWDELYPGAGGSNAAFGKTWLLPLSARSPGALSALALAYAERLLAADGEGRLADFAHAAGARRDHHPHRLAVVGRTRQDVAALLLTFARNGATEGVIQGPPAAAGRPKVVFVFPGQGSQWLGMGRQLLAEEPVFRAALEAGDAAIAAEAGFSVLEEIAADEARSRLAEIDVVQPLLFALEVALAALWRSWGVEPDAVIGHSMGEVAAAHVAGILSIEDAAKVICRRSRLLKRVAGQGAMGLVELTLHEAQAALVGYEDRLGVAVSNGPRSTVLSGDPAALEEVLAKLEKRGVFCRRVKVDVASHSPQMDPLRDDLLAALGDVRPRAATLAMRSTVTGAAVLGADLDAGYWVQNLRAPVLFSRATQQLVDEGHLLFVEMSPHPILLPAVEENLREKKREGASIASLRRHTDERSAMLQALGTLYARGVDPSWSRLFPSGGRAVSLPTYPWQRERYWIEPAPRAGGWAARAIPDGHPLLGGGFRPADRPDAHYWEQWVSAAQPAYVADHQVLGQVVFPGAGYVEMALAAATEVYGEGRFVLEALSFEWMLALEESQQRRVQVSLVDERGQHGAVVIASHDEATGQWVQHARAAVRQVPHKIAQMTEPPRFTLERCPAEVAGAAHYARMDARQIHYGPAFQGVERIWVGPGEAVGRVRLPAEAGEASAYRVHPALLDACLQVCAVLWGETDETFVPVEIARLHVHRRSWREAWVRATPSATPGANGEATVDLAVVDDDGRLLLEVGGLCARRLAGAPVEDAFADCAYTVVWRPAPLPARAASAAGSATWLVFADAQGTGAGVAAALRARGDTCFEVAVGTRFARLGPERYQMDPSRSDDYQRLFHEVVAPAAAFRGVVHCWNLDAAPWEETTADTLLADVRRGSASVLRVVQELVRQGLRDAPRLVLVTRGAQAAGEFAAELAVAQSALWGLGRTIAMEQPDLACTRIDLDPTPEADEAALVVQELVAGDGEDQIALRAGQRLVARLERGTLDPVEAPTFDAEGSYLITGGLGGLGLTAARWLVASGARHLLLLGRSAPSEQAEEAIRAMVEAGAEVRTWRADVARAADVAGALAYLEETMPPLRGILHAAGVLEDRTLLEMSDEQLTRAIGPKILGGWNLHAATQGIPLDFFVMYSSAASLLGPPGQGNYAAANAFLDALAHARAAHDLPGMSIQWGTFSEVGLAAAQENRGQRMAQRGIESFTPDEGTELLSRLIQHPCGEIGLLRMSVRQWIESYPRAASAPFLSVLRQAEERSGATPAAGVFLDDLRALSPIQRRPAFEQHVLECLGRVLHLPPERIEVLAPFRGYGMDSLMSLEIRNRLEASLGLRLSAALLFTYPTTASLVDHLLAELHIEAAGMDESFDGRSRDGQAGEELAEAVAVAMLDAKLSDLEGYLK